MANAASAGMGAPVGTLMPDRYAELSTQATGISYIQSHLIYVIVFILLTLVLFWTVGGKPTFYFLVLVLLGQLIVNATFISQLFQTT